MARDHALGNHREGLDIALKYYNWAPLNRIYGYCYHLIEPRLPQFLQRFRPVTIALGLLLSIIKYMQLNRGIRYDDIKALNLENLRKLRIPWCSLYETY